MLDKTLLILFAHCSQENASEFLKQIYDKYYKLVYFIAGKYLKRECDIEDVVIETFSSLYEDTFVYVGSLNLLSLLSIIYLLNLLILI